VVFKKGFELVKLTQQANIVYKEYSNSHDLPSNYISSGGWRSILVTGLRSTYTWKLYPLQHFTDKNAVF